MCTVSWRFRQLGSNQPGGFELFTNRDERRTRPAALPPRSLTTDSGRAFLAPVDEEGGGTWIAVNADGLALCLLNHYQAAELPSGVVPRSRGLVVTDLIDAPDVAGFARAVGELELAAVRGFRLIALDASGAALLATWDTHRLELIGAVAPPLVSSGFDFADVEAARIATFADLEREHGGVSSAMLDAFHRSERPAPGPYAVSMSRPDAWTVSHTRVVVDADAVELRYQPGQPAANGPMTTVRLARSGSSQ